MSFISCTYIWAWYTTHTFELYIISLRCSSCVCDALYACARAFISIYFCYIYCVYIYVFMLSLYIYVCVCIYIYIYVYRYIYVYTYMYICIYICIYVYIILCVCVCVYIRVFFLDRLGLVSSLSLFLSVFYLLPNPLLVHAAN